jgi:hypothetical protein
MAIIQSDYIDARERFLELGLASPTGITLLPRNFTEAASPDEFIYEKSTTTVRTLWRQNGVTETRLEADTGPTREIVEQGFTELVLPTIFVAGGLLSQNPVAVGVAINILSDYATHFFRGIPSPKRVKLSIVVETDKERQYKELNFEGSPEHLKDLVPIVREVYGNDQLP